MKPVNRRFKVAPMTTIQISDKPMCCSTGVCGPAIDPVLAQFASDLEWMRTQGVTIDRFNLGQQAQAFVDSGVVNPLLTAHGVDCLPVVVVDGTVVTQGVYPSRQSLAAWAGIGSLLSPLLVISGPGSCCSQPGCC